MREILFRGKCATTGQWVYGFYVKWDSLIDHETKTLHSIYFDSKFVLVLPETVGQWIGRTDSRGTKIFEGDKVYVDASGVGGSFEDGIYKVDYLLDDCAFTLVQLDELNGISFNECYVYTIIGNIHESI